MAEDATETIGLLANRRMRKGPDGLLIRFVREFEPYLRDVLKPRIYAVEGTYRALLRYGLLHDYRHLYCLPAGYQGGIVAISAMVVRSAAPAGATPDVIDRVIYLIDPRDPTSTFPESIALKRDCVVMGKPFLATYTGACEWTALQWHTTPDKEVGEHHPTVALYFLAPDLLRKLRQLHPMDHIGLAGQTIALIAHDAKKKEMIQFAYDHFDFLGSFEKRIATGTTGMLLNGQIPTRVSREWTDLQRELRVYKGMPAPTRLTQSLKEKKALQRCLRKLRSKLKGQSPQEAWVEAQPSGPRGGDVQIADLIRKQECHKVIFFEDPHVSREHEADIQLLERTARIPEQDVICLHDYSSAKKWALRWEECIEQTVTSPMTIFRAYRLLFDAELVLAGQGREHPRDSAEGDAIWEDIVEQAAWYIVGLVAERAHERLAEGDMAHVAVTWGYGMHDMIEKLPKVSQILNDLDDGLEARNLALSPRLADPRFVKPQNVLGLPMIGIMGTTDPRVEANQNVARLANFFGGRSELLKCNAFTARNLQGELVPIMADWDGDLWDRVDIAIFTCDRVKESFGSKATATMPQKLYDQMKSIAAGEIGGLFLDSSGLEVRPKDFVRVGISHRQLKAVAARGGAILIAGVQHRRLEPVLAALRGRLVSVLVTNLRFAWDVLESHALDP